MTSPPPLSSPEPSVFRRHGCLIALVTLVVLILAGVVGAYHALVRTALPYRAIAAMIEKNNPNLKISGIAGDLASGVSVASITWGDDPTKRSEVLDLRIKYNGYRDARSQGRIVIHDVGVRKAHVDLADFFPGFNSTSPASTSATSSWNSDGPSSGGLGNLEIERVDIEDVLVTNRLTDFRLAIPKIEWTGFKATPTSVDPGVLTVESDRLTIHTSAGRTLPFNGQNITFQKMLTGTVLPLLHPAIKQSIPFTADVSISPQGELRPLHLTSADDKLEIGVTKDGDVAVQIRGLDLANYIDAGKLFGAPAAEFPSDLVLKLGAAPAAAGGGRTIKVLGGSFRLGVATFQIEPLEFTEAGQAGAILQAVFRSDAENIVWALPLAKVGQEFHPHFISPGLSPEEILARVFAGRPYGQLNASEKKGVDERRAFYFPLPEK